MQYLFLLGQKSNGKSTAAKNVCVEAAIKHGQLFAYIRRYANDIKNTKVISYFKNIKGFNVKTISGGEYDSITARAGEIYAINTTDKSKKLLIGYYFALATYDTYSSLNYPDVKYFIFEEIQTLNGYLSNEKEKLDILVSTIIRDNGGTCFMVGNTMSNMCPYFREFQLTGIRTQELGTTDIYRCEDTNIGVYLTAPCDDKESYQMFFGAGSNMIKSGEWLARKQLKLEKDRDEYTTLYTCVLKYDDALFLMEFLRRNDTGAHLWFISKKTSEIQKGTRVIGNANIENELHTYAFTPLNDNEKIMFDYLKLNKIAYGDDLTGTEFKQAIKLLRGDNDNVF